MVKDSKFSTLTRADVSGRVNEAFKLIDSLYYFFSDQGFDEWLIYCDTQAQLYKLKEVMEDE